MPARPLTQCFQILSVNKYLIANNSSIIFETNKNTTDTDFVSFGSGVRSYSSGNDGHGFCNFWVRTGQESEVIAPEMMDTDFVPFESELARSEEL